MRKVDQELFEAVEQNSKEGIENALKAGANIEATDWDESTALHIAAKNGSIEVLDLLSKSGANMNAEDKDGMIAFYYAVEYGQVEASEWLLKRGANIEAPNRNGKTAIYFAASWEQAEALKTLVYYGAKIDKEGKKLIIDKCPKNTLQELEKISLNYRQKLVHQSASNLYKTISLFLKNKEFPRDITEYITSFVNKDPALHSSTVGEIAEAAFNHSKGEKSKKSLSQILNSEKQMEHNKTHFPTVKNINIFDNKKEELSQAKEVIGHYTGSLKNTERNLGVNL